MFNFSGNTNGFYSYIKELNEAVRKAYVRLGLLKNKRKTLECKLPCSIKVSTVKISSEVVEIDCPDGIPYQGGDVGHAQYRTEAPPSEDDLLSGRDVANLPLVHMGDPVIKEELWIEGTGVNNPLNPDFWNISDVYIWESGQYTILLAGGGGGGAAIAGNYFTQGGSIRGGYSGEHVEVNISLQKWWRVHMLYGKGGAGGEANYTAGNASASVANGQQGGATTVEIYDGVTLLYTYTAQGGLGGEGSISPSGVVPHDDPLPLGYDYGYPEETAVALCKPEFGDKLSLAVPNSTNFRVYNSQRSALRPPAIGKTHYYMFDMNDYGSRVPDGTLQINKGFTGSDDNLTELGAYTAVATNRSSYWRRSPSDPTYSSYFGAFDATSPWIGYTCGGERSYYANPDVAFNDGTPRYAVGGWACFGIHGDYTPSSDIDRVATGGQGGLGFVRMRKSL